MRNVMMFVAGFAVMTIAGVAVGLVASDTGGSGGDTWLPWASQVELPPGDSAESGETPAELHVPSGDVDTTTTVELDKDAEGDRPDADEKDTPTHVELVILHPTDGQHFEKGEAVLEGTTTPGAMVWSGDRVADVSDDGTWRLVVPLERGKNRVPVGAKLGDVSVTKELTLYYGEQLVWAITQKVKASETPFEKFYGTGSPGMRITASSPYGSNSTTIGDSGEWALGIEFHSSPGTTFPITVSTSTGWSKTYSFTHVGEKSSREWSITQKYVENTRPFTKFYGTGPAGTRILARSEYGSADTVIGSNGEWYLRVWFDPPKGKAFPVRVTNSLGFDKTYEFVWVGYEFTVNQKFGDNDQPWEKFWGTGEPGTVITFSSEYGGAHTTIGEGGEWQVAIEFPNAPSGKWFPISMTTSTGITKTFEFVYVAPDYGFWVEQVFGSCSENPPYDVFHGQTKPFSMVEISSPYGSARVEVGETGKWEKKVFFETAPVGTPFEVVVADSNGNSKTFTFTRLAADGA